MAEELNYHQEFNRVLAEWIKDPAASYDVDPNLLAALLERYPFSQPLHVIRATLSARSADAEKDLRVAVVYAPDRRQLHNLLNGPVKAPAEAELAGPAEVDLPHAAAAPAENKPATEAVAEPKPERSAEPVFSPTGASEPMPEPAAAPPAPEPVSSSGVSRYDDDKMPYTFLWWLSKTRNEHAETYRPYASATIPAAPPEIKKKPETILNDQIAENIFHLKHQMGESEDTRSTVPFQVKTREDKIIEKFIREDPIIKPLQAEKIDTENKARSSSEDQNELVSETLARIYTDQLLYDKAADTYRKLRLKFPEKSAYFADQIKQLERKI